MLIRRISLGAVATCLFIFPPYTYAEQIYQWEDESGKIHFSSTPNDKKFSPSKLQPISRENIDQKIKNIKAQTPPNCLSHGGVDCSRGADTDGSVICLDNYRGATLPFRFECMEARLQMDLLLILDKPGAFIKVKRGLERQLEKQLADHRPESLQLNVRNIAGAEAFGINVEFMLPRHKAVKAQGPDKISAYSSADYILTFESLESRPTLAEIEKTDYKVKCTNCSAVMKPTK